MRRHAIVRLFIRRNLSASSLSEWSRTHMIGQCSDAISSDSGVELCGWLQSVRKRRGGLFAMLRDHTGVVQLSAEGEAATVLASLPLESSLSVQGRVVSRPDGARNASMATGAVEVNVSRVTFTNPCTKSLPFQVGDTSVGEDVRLKHRFLDLRSPTLQHNLRARAEVSHAVRNVLRDMRFLEVETPYLFRPTPEGAKEFLVRTRWPGLWYSLPQSPQQYKQLLMMGGMDRYFQIARCFRDEDMRLERQPEFTQVDLEMSFARERDVQEVTENVVRAAVRAVHGPQVTPTFSRMPYRDAMRMYGSDKPDLRIASRIEGLAPSSFKMLKLSHSSNLQAKDVQGVLRDDEELAALVDGKWSGAARGKIPEALRASLAEKHPKGIVFVRGGANEMQVCSALGKLRLALERGGLSAKDTNALHWLWVEEFPMFEQTSEGEWKAAHHPFTAPVEADEHLIVHGGPAAYHARARSYDLVLNGVEMGGGSVRIHSAPLQLAALRLIGVDEEKARSTLGHLLEALEMGAPPHAGLAFGLDRMMMGLLGAPTLKDVIAFPKAADGKELMVSSPSAIE